MLGTRNFGVFCGVAVMAALGGCKLHVISPPSGDIASESGSLDCPGGSVCAFEITETDFSEEFTAIPRSGYRFVRWQAGDGFLCANTEGATCIIQAPENEELAGKIINSLVIVSIMPVFSDTGIDSDGDGYLDSEDTCPDFGVPGAIDELGCPREFVTVLAPDGNEWSQPMEFLGLSWDEVDSVCPAGVCAGILKGYDLTGWTWANIDQANAVFNSYGHSPVMGPGPDSYSSRGGTYWKGVWDFICVDGEGFSGADDCFITTGSAQPISATLSALLSGVPSEVSMLHNAGWGAIFPQFPVLDRYTTRVIGAASANVPQSGRGVLLFRAQQD